jgi:hypothetical protein
LGKRPSVSWVAPAQDDLDASYHGACGIGFGDLSAGIGFRLDSQMAFDTGDGVNDYAL